METESKPLPPPASEDAVSRTMKEGFEKVVGQAGIGLVVGGITGFVITRGRSSSARKLLAGFGAGIGAGSAWTRCSMDIEDVISKK